jgi:indoleamine 2,3-dioxygenase
MTIHANGKPNSGLLASGQFGDAVKQELKGLNLEQKVDEAILSDDQVRNCPLRLFVGLNMLTR